ncbi:hypothetical protein BDFB_007764, partial [Asbolus verrucosus]
MIRGAISVESRSLLVFIQGTMTAERYIGDVLQEHALPYIRDIPGRKISNLPQLSQTLAALRHEVGVVWDSVSQEEIDNLLRSILRRVQECITQK